MFSFLVSELANKFNFFSIQTGWHFSVEHRKRKLEALLVKQGKLSADEVRSLQKLAHLLQRHSFGKGFIGTPFFKVKDNFSYSDFEGILSEEEFKDLEESFEVLDTRWQRIWREEKTRLLQWKDVLRKDLEKNVDLASFSETLVQLYGEETFEKYIVHLLISAADTGGGGAWTGIDNDITLECSGLVVNEENKKILLGTLFHEISHLLSKKLENEMIVPYLRENNFFDFGERIEGIPTVTFFSEAAVHAFLPRGVLGRKYLETDSTVLYEEVFNEGKEYPLLASWGIFVAEKLKDTAKSYADKNLALDEEFLNKVCAVLREFSA